MRRICKTFTFWFVLVSVFEIFMHQIGQDSKSIVLIGLNPLLNMFSDADSIKLLLDSGFLVPCNTIVGSISIYWYVASMVSYLFYGILLDLLRYFWKKHRT